MQHRHHFSPSRWSREHWVLASLFASLAILVATIIAWNVLADWATYKSEWMQKMLEPPPLLLIDNGRMLHRHLRMEFLSESELRSKLREHGVTDFREVKKAFMESDGQISVIKRQPA